VQPVVRLRSAVCLLDRFPALAGVDLDVNEGEVVLVSGGNGAGKSTLLRLIAGLLPLHSGNAEVLGVDLHDDRRSHRRSLALVGHDSGCYDDLTVRENLLFATRAIGASSTTMDRALELLGLCPLADVLHRRLSKGQQRRLSLAIAVARGPRLLLLDEPHAGLDEEGRAVVDEVLLGVTGGTCTVMLASHELERARSLAQREIVLTSGRVAAAPSPATRHPEPARA
jgi:heme ABC exporter ATP-binding subunit CcmA